jgi:hypothetical protein
VKDLYWAAGSFFFVLAYITVHVKSIFLSSLAMIQVLYAFPIGFLIYRSIFRISYFSTLHILVIFVILGIAADKIFIYTDCWNQTEHIPHVNEDRKKRMAYTSRRSMKATLVTTCTTTMAFIATGLSSIIPISTFGFFAATVVMMNFLFTFTFYPATIILNEKYIKKCAHAILIKLCCPSTQLVSIQTPTHLQTEEAKTQGQQTEEFQSERERDKLSKPADNVCQDTNQNLHQITPKKLEFDSDIDIAAAKAKHHLKSPYNPELFEDLGTDKLKSEPEFGAIETFMGKYLNRFTKAGRFVIVAVFIGLMIGGVCLASQMKSLSETEKFLPADMPSYEAMFAVREEFHQGSIDDIAIKVDFVFGVKSLDTQGTDKFDPLDVGQPVWDYDFTLAPTLNQIRIIEICDMISVCSSFFYFF